MFQTIQPRRGSRPRIILILSVAAHAAALVALVAAAAWQVDKLNAGDQPLFVAAGPGAPLPSAGDDSPEPERPKKKRQRRSRELAPVDRAAAQEDDGDGGDSTGGEGDGAGPGDGLGHDLFPCAGDGSCSLLDEARAPLCGNGRVETGEDCDDGNLAAGDGCSSTCRLDKEHVVVSRMIEGHRISGDPQIAAPDRVRQEMSRSGVDQVNGTIKMCLDREGRVRSLRVLKSTGFSEYDRRLLSGMRGWRYRPYKLDSGAPVPVCTVVTFIYRVQ